MSAAVEQALRSAYAALDRGDAHAALAPLAPDAEWHESEELPGGGILRGRGEIERFLADFLASWDEFRQEVEDVVVRGDRACVVLRSLSRGRGSGVPVEGRYAHVWTFRDGRGVRVDAFYDVDAARAALAER